MIDTDRLAYLKGKHMNGGLKYDERSELIVMVDELLAEVESLRRISTPIWGGEAERKFWAEHDPIAVK